MKLIFTVNMKYLVSQTINRKKDCIKIFYNQPLIHKRKINLPRKNARRQNVNLILS